jgi:two-component system CheB/CheR fusion protein
VELEAIYRTAPVGLCVLDAELRFVRINERLAEINGVPAADHLGRTVREVLPHLADAVEPPLRRILETGTPVLDVEINGETPAQPGVTRTWIESWFPLEDETGRTVGINIVAEEVTERKRAERELAQSEERFYTALKHSPVVFAHVDRELRYEWIFNPHPDFDASAVVGRRDDELDEGPGVDALVRLKQRVLERGVQEREQIAFSRSGGAYWYDMTATPVLGEDGRVERIVTASIDITEQKKAEAALHELTETLAERVRERTRQVRELASALTLAEQTERRRVAQVLHDGLQQQLYGVQFPLQMLEEDLQLGDVPPEDLRENVVRAGRYIREAIETAKHLMVNLSPPVLQGEGLAEALKWLAAQMRERFSLHVDVRCEDGLAVPTDDMRVLLFQTVRELLFNIVKHAYTDRARVTLREEEDHLFIDVVDEGAGFDAASVEGPPDASSGFGLYHARERLGLFGGRMDITSEPGAGARITLSVPTERLQQNGV